jgi:hypothetical protein
MTQSKTFVVEDSTGEVAVITVTADTITEYEDKSIGVMSAKGKHVVEIRLFPDATIRSI